MKQAALLISLVVVSAVAGGSFAYGWHSVINGTNRIALTEDTVASSSPLPIDIAAETSLPKAAKPHQMANTRMKSSEQSDPQWSDLIHDKGQISVALDEPQLNQLINEAIFSQPQAAQILVNAKSFQTTLKSDLIETGAVLNLSELPRDGLPAEVQTGLDQLASAAPMLANRDIYIGIVARPQVQDGKLNLEEDMSLKLGQFTFPLADIEDQMGFSTNEVERRLNTLLNQQGVILETIEIFNEQLVITGARS
ncbi:hypothetical protein [Leptothoe spongobia]|uniref:Uncharacterized protein n=1 Tax=Leptothoe spongobia TAU-MAC 1115 TaxID=1967444 RepID=A0A947GGB6_9CYAN|nr:hypothetical protein [Leptothoe spongobia]MBT9314274.1 hypothetical protein [Leptothoe spongobia TAU-MAC 1115]